MPAKFEIPDFLRHLPVDDRGYPVPFFVPWKGGKPMFLYADERKVANCADRRICGICGKLLTRLDSFMITGPIGLSNRVASDAPMHKRCAEYSMKICPHMYFEKAQRRSHVDDGVHAMHKPSHLYLVRLLSFEMKYEPRAGQKLIQYVPGEAEEYHYVNGLLQKIEP